MKNSKIVKGIVIAISIIVLIAGLLFAGYLFAIDYIFDMAFDKLYEEIVVGEIKPVRSDGKGEKQEENKSEEIPPKNIIQAEDGNEYEVAEEEGEDTKETVATDGKTYITYTEPYVPPQNTETVPESETAPETEKQQNNVSSTDKALDNIYTLTPQQLEEIKNMVTVSDKAAVINICKACLTVEDKREIKAMLDSGAVDYGRVRAILSMRLSVSSKKQIYAYYEKYVSLYFESKGQ